jgi:hypothetical protein
MKKMGRFENLHSPLSFSLSLSLSKLEASNVDEKLKNNNLLKKVVMAEGT